MHSERIDPEMIRPFGIAGGDVPRDAFIESEFCEQPEGRRQRSLRWRRSSAAVANVGGVGMRRTCSVAVMITQLWWRAAV